MKNFPILMLALAICFITQQANAQMTPSQEDKILASKVIGRFDMSCAEIPNLDSHWLFTKEGRAIQDGNDMGAWSIVGGKTIITFTDKQFGLAVLSFKNEDTLVGKNEHRNGSVFNWVLKREKTEVAQKPKEEAGKTKDEKTLLQGRWYAVAEEAAGETLSKDEIARLNKILDVTGDEFRMARTSGGKRGSYVGTIRLGQNDGQKLFDFEGKGPGGAQIELHGIYEMTEDVFKVCFTTNLAGKGYIRPREFRTSPGIVFVTFKRSAEKVEVAQKPKEKSGNTGWDHIKITGKAKVMDDFMRIEPLRGTMLILPGRAAGRAVLTEMSLVTKESYSGPVEITVVARITKEDATIRLNAFDGMVIFNERVDSTIPEKKNFLRVQPPNTKWLGKDFGVSPMVSLTPNVWHTFTWRITRFSAEIRLDNKAIYLLQRRNDLSKSEPVGLSNDPFFNLKMPSALEVKEFSVKQLQESPEELAAEKAVQERREQAAKIAKEQREAFAKEMAKVKNDKDYLPPKGFLESEDTFNGVKALLGQPSEVERSRMDKNGILCIWNRGKSGYIAIYFVDGGEILVRGGIFAYGTNRQNIDQWKRFMRGQGPAPD